MIDRSLQTEIPNRTSVCRHPVKHELAVVVDICVVALLYADVGNCHWEFGFTLVLSSYFLGHEQPPDAS
uniref:Uncharacterized protein n=1 Tax=uncultured planctomycete 13FN TaxID=455065 RepID=A9LH62_9BACT|nr:hypothetical protein 13FN_24 [uncultured planctomycete 13FN]